MELAAVAAGLGAAATAAVQRFRTRHQVAIAEAARAHAEAAAAERRMHDLTRAAFVAMAERATELRAVHVPEVQKEHR